MTNMKYICNNKKDSNNFGKPCERIWHKEDLNQDIDSEYLRGEKCPKCGGTDITKVKTTL